MFKRLTTLLFGLGLISLGVFLFLASEQAYAVQWLKRFWPLFLVLAGLVRFSNYLLDRQPASPVGSLGLMALGGIWLAVNWRGEDSFLLILGHYWFWLLLAYVIARLLRQYLHRPQDGKLVRAFSPGGIFVMLIIAATGLSANFMSRHEQWLAHFDLGRRPLFESGELFFGTPLKIEDVAPQSFKLPAKTQLLIEQLNGDVEIRPGNGPLATARLTKFFRTRDEARARAAATSVQMQITNVDNRVHLSVASETVTEPFTVALLIEIPRQASLDLAISDPAGTVKLHELRGDHTLRNCGKLTISRHSGRLNVTGARDAVEISDSQGEITLTQLHRGAELNEIDGRISLEAQGGNYRLKNIRGAVRARASNARLELNDLSPLVTAAKPTAANERLLNLDELRDTRVSLTDIHGAVFINASRSKIEADNIIGAVEINAEAETVRLNEITGDVRILARNGSIALTELQGAAQLEAARDISVQNFAGPLNIKSQAGRIRLVNQESLQGDVVVLNEHGSINVTLPKNIPVRLDAVSQTGHVRTRGFETPLKALAEPTESKATAPLLRLHSATGNIEIQASGSALASRLRE